MMAATFHLRRVAWERARRIEAQGGNGVDHREELDPGG
ncbi:MAG: hypothetical protein QOE90_690 [Thermoplasmata archaeon]|jgi:hypothetical protein|nr:hypothetical protein [Thermoplasmata archaeon]